jgi:hypothetical protein
MWDYYQDKLLRAMLIDYNFDFHKVSDFFKRTTGNQEYTPLACQTHWAEIHQQRKKGSDDPLKSPLDLLISKLPQTRTAKNHLEVTREDLAEAYTEDFNGQKVKVSGLIIRLQCI